MERAFRLPLVFKALPERRVSAKRLFLYDDEAARLRYPTIRYGYGGHGLVGLARPLMDATGYCEPLRATA
jgi:hypothetical protein